MSRMKSRLSFFQGVLVFIQGAYAEPVFGSKRFLAAPYLANNIEDIQLKQNQKFSMTFVDTFLDSDTSSLEFRATLPN